MPFGWPVGRPLGRHWVCVPFSWVFFSFQIDGRDQRDIGEAERGYNKRTTMHTVN